MKTRVFLMLFAICELKPDYDFQHIRKIILHPVCTEPEWRSSFLNESFRSSFSGYLINKISSLIKLEKILIPNEMQLKILAGIFVYNFILICHMYHIHNKHTIHLKRKRYKRKIRLTSHIKPYYS